MLNIDNYAAGIENPNVNKNIQKINLHMAKGVSDAIRTSLGPHGMDKGIISDQEILITNDGATILNSAIFNHPAAKMLVNISKSQDLEVGDGTTSVVVLSGSFLGSCLNLLDKGISPTKISDNFRFCLKKAQETLICMALPVDLNDENALYQAASTSLESKVISVQSHLLSPVAVKSVLRITDLTTSCDVNLKNIKIIKKVGGTIEQTELLDGVGIEYPVVKSYNGPTKIISAKIAYIQFHISLPAIDNENTVIVKDYLSMDRILREEKQYIVSICRKIRSSGCNVLLIQKSILRESISNLALQILAEMQIMVIKDISREDLDFITTSFSCVPIVDIESISLEKLGYAEIVEEKTYGSEKITCFKGIKSTRSKTASVVIRSSNRLLLQEAERSFHDALCVIRSIVRRRYLVGGGGSAEIEISFTLKQFSKSMTGADCFCIMAFANSLEVIPYTLSENAGLEPIDIVSQLRTLHSIGNKFSGINVKKGLIENMFQSNIVSPLLVMTSILNMSVEFVIQLLKIDSIIEAI
nr:T-complex protein 1, delta SU [Cryptomonas sp.]